MTNIIQLPKRFGSDFQNPKVKPISQVEIDDLHPASRGAVFTMLSDDNTGHDIALGALPASKGHTVSATPDGRQWDFSATASTIYPARTAYNVTGNLSAIFIIDPTTSINQIICEIAQGTGETLEDNSLLFIGLNPSDDSVIRYIHEYSTGLNELFDTTSAFTSSTKFTLIVVRNVAANTVKFYVDGVLLSTFNYTNQPDNTGGVCKISIGGRVDDTLLSDSSVVFSHITSTAWSESVVQEISKSPYSFLNLATPPQYFIPAAAVGGKPRQLPLMGVG